jgi:hypothetical protein
MSKRVSVFFDSTLIPFPNLYPTKSSKEGRNRSTNFVTPKGVCCETLIGDRKRNVRYSNWMRRQRDEGSKQRIVYCDEAVIRYGRRSHADRDSNYDVMIVMS